MARRVLTILLFLAAVELPGTSAPQGLDRDSEFWNSLNDGEKIVFLQGVYTGLFESLQVMGEEASRQKDRDPYWIPPFVHERTTRQVKEYFSDTLGFDYKTMSGLLDAFYSNPDNGDIDVMSALHILMLHQDGHIRRANELLLMKQRETLKDR
ncbi:MAG: hypothetical protein ACE5HZ_05320 [Fidelibacterota bacterium]